MACARRSGVAGASCERSWGHISRRRWVAKTRTVLTESVCAARRRDARMWKGGGLIVYAL